MRPIQTFKLALLAATLCPLCACSGKQPAAKAASNKATTPSASTANEYGVGKPCRTTVHCALNGAESAKGMRCGAELQGPRRKPDSCTRACKDDKNCGRKAPCLDLDHGLPPRSDKVATRYPVPAWRAI